MKFLNRTHTNFLRLRGFSLFELLIYIAILSGLMVIVSSSFLSLSKGRAQAQGRSEVQASIRFATERLRQDIKSASAVSVPSSGAASSTLSLLISGTTVTYDMATSTLRRKEGAATPVAITGNSVLVTVPSFSVISNYNSRLQATTTAVQILMTFMYNASSTDWTYSNTLRTSVTLR
jgi:Tfp pilus assembly protein PilW